MREGTFIAAMYALDMMMILAGGVMAWSHAIPPHAVTPHAAIHTSAGVAMMNAVIVMILVAGIGGYGMYEVNVFAFRIAEKPAPDRTARWVAAVFIVATLAGGLIGLA